MKYYWNITLVSLQDFKSINIKKINVIYNFVWLEISDYVYEKVFERK